MTYHDPVLLHECLTALNVKENGIYVDATFGGGGHSREILKKLKSGKLLGFDQDEDAVQNIPEDKNFVFVKHNFSYLKRFLRYYDLLPVDGILADLGVSSHQFDIPDRGFSTRFDAELDMRMNQHSKLTAAMVINEYGKEELKKIFSEYGEIPNAGKLADVICSHRVKNPIHKVNELKEVIQRCVFKEKENQYHAKVFQALRIEVNQELAVLKEFLARCAEVLAPGGILAVISYHSLEDRLVKNFINKGKFEGELDKDIYGNVQGLSFRMATKKALVPGEEELLRNPRSRSAKLRIAEKI